MATKGVSERRLRLRNTSGSSATAACKACDSVASGTKKAGSLAGRAAPRSGRWGGRRAPAEASTTKGAKNDRTSRSPVSAESESGTAESDAAESDAAGAHLGQLCGSNPAGMSQRRPHRGHFQRRRVIMPSIETTRWRKRKFSQAPHRRHRGTVRGRYRFPPLFFSLPYFYLPYRLSSFESWLVKPAFCICVNSSLCMGSSVTTIRTVSPDGKNSATIVLS